jgi:hypothetical protein
MRNWVFRKAAFFALIATAAGVSSVACSSNPAPDGSGEGAGDGRLGRVGLTLQPVSGVIISSVSYSVTQGQSGAVVTSGSLPVPGAGADLSFGVPLPVGTGYFLTLSGATADGQVTCAGGFGPFNITANATIDITPMLTCTDITTGQPVASVDVSTTACPDVTFDYVVATPSSAVVGQQMGLLSNAVSASGKLLSYQWSASSPGIGVIIPANAKDASLECASAGGTLIATVTASNGECSKSLSTTVTCHSGGGCGNGVVDRGETCDVALEPSCPADCVHVCGDGVVEAGESCEPPNTAACGDTCQMREPICGDGFINGSEPCDIAALPTGAPAGRTCENLGGVCQLAFPIGLSLCGNGIAEFDDTCDNPGGNNYAIANCGDVWGSGTLDGAANDCSPITSATCARCEASSECAELMDPSFLAGSAVAGPALGTPRSELYFKTLDCVRDTTCAVANVYDCYCGSVSSEQCDAGGGNGACKTIIEQGLETTNPIEIAMHFSNVTLGAGLALSRVACDQLNCRVACSLDAAVCGDGIVQLGETCERSLDPTCPADCTQYCGDGMVEGSETCEPPGTATCSSCRARTQRCLDGFVTGTEACDPSASPTGAPAGSTCTSGCEVRVGTCGNGVVEAVESCEPPNTASCSATCGPRAQACRDGFVTGSEACDPTATPTGAPAGAGCSFDCEVHFVDDTCGNGVVEADETCDNPGANNYAIDDCGDIWGSNGVDGAANDCKPISSAACASCELASECAELLEPDAVLTGNAVEGPATGQPRRELYFKTLDCLRDTGCAVGNLLDCYCGAASAAQCDSGNGSGVCRTVIEQGLETTNPTEISNRLSNVTLGGGLALARVACDKQNCASPCGL